MIWADGASILFVARYLTGFSSSSSVTFSVITNRTSPNFDTGSVFVPIVFGEELVECSLTLGGKDLSCDPSHGLAAGRSKTCHVRFGTICLVIRQRVKFIQRTGTREKICYRQHQPSVPSTPCSYLNVQSRVT